MKQERTPFRRAAAMVTPLAPSPPHAHAQPAPIQPAPIQPAPIQPAPVLPGQAILSWVVAAAVALLLVVAVLDPALRDLARTLDPDLRGVFKTLTRLGNAAWPLVTALVGLAGLHVLRRQACGRTRVALRRAQVCLWFLIGSVALSGVTASLLKNSIGRARPSVVGAEAFDFSAFAFQAAQASFPSGHATTAMAMMVALALIVPRLAVGAISFGALIALSRCLIGVHWFSDVIAGAALGVAVTLVLRFRLDRGRRRALLSPAVGKLLRIAIFDAISRSRYVLVNFLSRLACRVRASLPLE